MLFLPNSFLGEGGDLTLFMTGKKPRPDTEPMYSGGNLLDYPISNGNDLIEYTDFIKSNIRNSRRIVISQSIYNGYFSACFATSTLYRPRPKVTWRNCRDNSSFLTWVKAQWEKSMRIYSLAWDEKFGFGVFLMENYGTDQIITTNSSDIKKFWANGFKITACVAQGSTIYIVMTKGTKEYEGKRQRWFFSESWNDDEIEVHYKTGRIITGICYSTELEKYFVVMTEMLQEQCYVWQPDSTKNENINREAWVKKKQNMGYYPSIIFTDPNDDHTLFVMTKDESVKFAKCKVFHKMEN